MEIMAISGSLRKVSSNTTLLRAVQRLAPEGVLITIYTGLGDLPHFNPDLEGQEPQSVFDLRAQMQKAAGVLICSPEYAHGVPGVLKNALDWLVGSGETVNKPFALLNASPRATHAQASLTEILTTMAAIIVPEASVTLSLLGKNLDENALLEDPEKSRILQDALTFFVEYLRSKATIISETA